MKIVKSLVLPTIILFLLFMPVFSYDVSEASNNELFGERTPIDPAGRDLWEFITEAVNIFLGVVVALSVIMLIYAGFTYITGGGDEKKVGASFKMILYALVGVVVALLSRVLVSVIEQLARGL